MPMVVGLPRPAAEAAARSASRIVPVDVVQVPLAGIPAGTVAAQVPAAGSALSRSSRVRLTVAAAALPGTWIGLDARAQRVNWLWTGVLTLVFAGVPVGIWLDPGGPRPSGDGLLVGAVVFGIMWLPAFLYMINRGYGKTRLTADQMQFYSFVSRRRVPWDEVTRIEMHRHQNPRGGAWWYIRVHRTTGRPLAVPGAFTFGSGAADLATLTRKRDMILEYLHGADPG